MSETRVAGQEWTPDDLLGRLERDEALFVLDVRGEDEFHSRRIEGRAPLEVRNAPYFELIERAGSDDPAQVARAAAGPGHLPRDRPLLVVCAKGGASAFVAEGLRALGYAALNLQGGMTAWGDAYAIKPLEPVGAARIHQVIRVARGCLAYVVSSAGRAAVVDPGRHVQVVQDLLRREGLRLEFVLDTHAHADHVSGGPALARAADVPYYLHPYDAVHPIDVLPARIRYEPLRDGQELPVGETSLKMLHVPGHTLGNLAVLAGGRDLLTGDSIFVRSIARPDLGGRAGPWARLHYHSLRRLLELPDDVRVLPGHFGSMAEGGADGAYQASLGELRRDNDGLRWAQATEAEFVSRVLAHLPEYPSQYVEIKRVNAGLSTPDEDEISELEIGKNVCAMAQAAGAHAERGRRTAS